MKTPFSISKKIIAIALVFYFGLLFHFFDNNPFALFAQNNWVQKADFNGSARYGAVGFTIGNKGYVGTGYYYDITKTAYKDFWEWDQTTNTWTQKADFGGLPRAFAVGFTLGTKGYIGTGTNDNISYQDFWEWDQTSNIWSQKANFGGGARGAAVGFSVGTKGYIGTGYDQNSFYKDFWEWEQATDTWTKKADFEGSKRLGAIGFSIGAKGYIGTGASVDTALTYKKDFWEWNQATNIWVQKADFGGSERYFPVGFSIGNKGYIGTGVNENNNVNFQDFWEWDQLNNVWSQKSNFNGSARAAAIGIPINGKGYIGTGIYISTKTHFKDFWEISFCSVTPTITVTGTTVLCNGNSVTLTSSSASSYLWSNGANTKSITVSSPGNYFVSTKDATGCSSSSSPVNITAQIDIKAMSSPALLCGTGTVQLLVNTSSSNYTYKWSPNTGLSNSTIANPTANLSSTTTYFLTVTDNSNNCWDTSSVTIIVKSGSLSASITAGGPTTFCTGGSVTLTANSGSAYQWTSGENTQSITVSNSGSYKVKVFNPDGCPGEATSQLLTVNVTTVPTAVITPVGPTTSCGVVKLSANSGSAFLWSNGANTQNIDVTQSGSYTVTISNAGGCTGSATSAPVLATVKQLPLTPVISQNGITLTSDSPLNNQWFLNGLSISGAILQNYVVKENGIYTVSVTNTDGCVSVSASVTINNVGIQEISKDMPIKIFPNPTTGIFMLETGSLHVKQIRIFNILGEVFYSSNINTRSDKHLITIQEIPCAIYILQIQTEKKTYYSQFIKE